MLSQALLEAYSCTVRHAEKSNRNTAHIRVACRIAEEAIRAEWGMKPLYVREGGTMPVAAVCENILQVSRLHAVFASAAPFCKQFLYLLHNFHCNTKGKYGSEVLLKLNA